VAAITGSDRTVGLKANAVSLWGDLVLVVSIANVAPSSSVAFTLSLLVGFTGSTSPLAVIVAGIAMFFAAMGYASLNRWQASAGAPMCGWARQLIPRSVMARAF